MSDVVIRAEKLSKLYRIGQVQRRHDSLLGATLSALSSPVRNFKTLRGLDAGRSLRNGEEQAESLLWALRDVSFEVERGEALGVIGRNGAGKSTLLKIFSRVTEPTSGRVRLRGRVSSLLEVGTGFNPELTGRENIFLNGTILGMTRREIERKFEEIVAFSGVARFLDTPVKRYSSGMTVRLAFAVAAHLEPEILIIDEVLAVGDAEFQKKCMGKMREVTQRGGRTILFVSHNLAAVRTLCQKAITLEGGRLVGHGPVEEQVSQYFERLADHSTRPLATRTDFDGHGRTRITDVKFLDHNGASVLSTFPGDRIRVVIYYESEQVGKVPEVAMSWFSNEGYKAFHIDSHIRGARLAPLRSSGQIVCEIGRLPVVPGLYHVNFSIEIDKVPAYHIYSAATIDVSQGDFYGTGRPTTPHGGVFFLDHEWETSAGRETALVNGSGAMRR